MTQITRPIVITGNWKMHKTVEEATVFVEGLIPKLSQGNIQVGLAVPFTSIFPLAKKADGTLLKIGAQNMNDASEGAFTGEVAAKMLKDAGATFVILGHSERRRLYKEDNDFINRKVKRAIESGLQPFLCVGESQEEHDTDSAHPVVETQLRECLKEIPAEKLRHLVVAYEPVWAIGSNKSATAEQAQEMHQFIRKTLGELLNPENAQSIVIQYGGSVNAANASDFLKQTDIDGLLIGGSSLSLETFSKILDDIYQALPESVNLG